MIEDLLLKEPVMFSIPGVRNLDYRKIVALSEQDFANFYLEIMTEYRDKDGWWSEGKIPQCSECHKEISGPADLRRHYGISMHAACFKEFYHRSSKETGVMKKYWDRVAALVLDF